MKKLLTYGLIVLLAFQSCTTNENIEPEPEQEPEEIETGIPPARTIIDDSPPDYDNPDGEWTLTQVVAGDNRTHYTYSPGRRLEKVTVNYERVYTLHYDGDLLKKITVLPKLEMDHPVMNFDSVKYSYLNGRMSNADHYYDDKLQRYDTLTYNTEGKLIYVSARFPGREYQMLFKNEWERDNVKKTTVYLVNYKNNKDTTFQEAETYKYDTMPSPYRGGNRFNFEWLIDNFHGCLMGANNYVERKNLGFRQTATIVYSFKNGLPVRAFSKGATYLDYWNDIYFSYKKK